MGIKDELMKPFPEAEIEWRVSQSGVTKEGKAWLVVLPYLTNRSIMDRLDEVFGWDGWNVEFYETQKQSGFLCKIAVFSDGKIVTKMDGAECTDFESMKGGISGSMKRAAVQFGIGRYLYGLNKTYYGIICEKDGADHRDKITGKNNKKDGQDMYVYWKNPKL